MPEKKAQVPLLVITLSRVAGPVYFDPAVCTLTGTKQHVIV